MFLRRRMRGGLIAATAGALALAFSLLAGAAPPFVNSDFETGDLTGWTTFTTANGTLGTPAVVSFDTTGSGASNAARFNVGQVVFGGPLAGGGIYQDVVTGAGTFALSADIASQDPPPDAQAACGLFELLVDGAIVASHDFAHCASGTTERSTLSATGLALAAGSHEIRIRITRGFVGGTTDTPLEYVDNFALVVTPPNTIIDSKPPANTNSTSATFAFHGVPAPGGSAIDYLECMLDAGVWYVCTSPQNLGPLPAGPHTFKVRAYDNDGNVDPTPAMATWLIDTTPPVLTFVIEQESGGPGVWTPYTPDTWTTFKVRATWTCTDTVGGGGLIHWLPSGPTHPVNVTTFVQTWTNNGVFTQAPRGTSGADRCQDRAGNSSPGAPAASFKVKKDSSLPLCSVSGSVKLIPVGVNTAVTWALVTSDSVSGVATTELFSLLGAGATVAGWDLGSPADTTGTVLFNVKPASITFTWLVTDNAGNKKFCSATAQAK